MQKCGKQYIGETYRTFGERMNEHLRYIKNQSKYDEPKGRHFNLPGYDHKRIEKEEFFIDQLKTRHPMQLND